MKLAFEVEHVGIDANDDLHIQLIEISRYKPKRRAIVSVRNAKQTRLTYHVGRRVELSISPK